MNKKDIIVTIKDTHTQDGDSESSELITTGVFVGTDEGFSISYNEQNAELESCVTTLRVEGNEKVVMTRTGRYTAEMIMEKNKRHNCHYTTPFGGFMLGVYAKNIESSVADNGSEGKLNLKYTIDFNSSNATENELDILFEEVKRNVTVS
ncbi:MAG: DUF1934 domain-containing protein [Clostridia bacterium]|nr:DUF1934 domain-containing protein [Clostridia bacterium]